MSPVYKGSRKEGNLLWPRTESSTAKAQAPLSECLLYARCSKDKPESSDGRQGTARHEGGRAGGSQVVRHPVAKPREDWDLESGDGWLPTQGSNSIKLSCYWYLERSPFKLQTFSQEREKKHVSQSSTTCPKSRMKFESCICRSLRVLIHSALTDQYF